MSKIIPHEMLDQEDVDSNMEDLLSYENMRTATIEAIKAAKGLNKRQLQQVLDVLDLSAEIALHSDRQQEIEAEIYSILS